MTLTFELDVDSVKVFAAEYLREASLCSEGYCPDTNTDTHQTNCSNWTNKVVKINVHTVKLLIIKLALFILPMLDIVILGNIAFTQRPSESRSRKLFSKVNKHTLS